MDKKLQTVILILLVLVVVWVLAKYFRGMIVSVVTTLYDFFVKHK